MPKRVRIQTDHFDYQFLDNAYALQRLCNGQAIVTSRGQVQSMSFVVEQPISFDVVTVARAMGYIAAVKETL